MQLDKLVTGSALRFVMEIWPNNLGNSEGCDLVIIATANRIIETIIKNKIERAHAFDSWRYGFYVSDNSFSFIQELIWSNCWPTRE